MSNFKMIYDDRNRSNLGKLADTTKMRAYQLYQYCIDNKIQILIYETIRTKEQQAEYVRTGKSKTMQSYHLIGQALDWVLVDNNKNALWNGYNTANGQKVIKEAKRIGFTSGYDWGWDAPHLQWDRIAYGKDTFGKVSTIITAKDDDNMQLKDATSSTLKKSYIEKIEQAHKEGKIGEQWVKQAKDGTLNVVDMILLTEYIR